MSPALNGSSAIWHFEDNKAIEICDRITFDFYTGLPQMLLIKFLNISFLNMCLLFDWASLCLLSASWACACFWVFSISLIIRKCFLFLWRSTLAFSEVTFLENRLADINSTHPTLNICRVCVCPVPYPKYWWTCIE